ncbi:MAG: hypothetical protein KAS93_04270 [Gammaproteobacteria bacterium]|nr:hypothetical protein [Gammaproteobacteria bacterium]
MSLFKKLCCCGYFGNKQKYTIIPQINPDEEPTAHAPMGGEPKSAIDFVNEFYRRADSAVITDDINRDANMLNSLCIQWYRAQFQDSFFTPTNENTRAPSEKMAEFNTAVSTYKQKHPETQDPYVLVTDLFTRAIEKHTVESLNKLFDNGAGMKSAKVFLEQHPELIPTTSQQFQ